ncbi:MAG TPA: hypothetical protein VK437_05695 [Steroidobacteraceae bacterium]|nr:hypothetical protein [Steroidobacteraceae bacterium]
MAGRFTKVAVPELATLMSRAALSPEAQEALRGCEELESAIDRLETAGFQAEAIRVLAHALPKRESVWWACMCADSTAPPELAEEDRLARESAELWVRQQTDGVRRDAMAHAQASGFMTAESWTGVAAFWSGDSLAPLDEPVIAPLPEQTGSAVAAAVTLASVRGEGEHYASRVKRFLESGRDIASGGFGRMERQA